MVLPVATCGVPGMFLTPLCLSFLYIKGGRSADLRELPSRRELAGFPGGSVVKNVPANAGDVGSIPDLGRSHMPWGN